MTERAAGGVTYLFNLPNRVYDVTLKYAETYYTAPGDRVFNVVLNGVTVLPNFDIFKDVTSLYPSFGTGKNIADDKTFAVTVTNGTLELDETASVQIATLMAIGIVPIVPPTATPTATFTVTPTLGLTATATPTFSLTQTLTRTYSPTATFTSTFSSTPTPTVSLTPSPTLSVSSYPYPDIDLYNDPNTNPCFDDDPNTNNSIHKHSYQYFYDDSNQDKYPD